MLFHAFSCDFELFDPEEVDPSRYRSWSSGALQLFLVDESNKGLLKANYECMSASRRP